MNDHMSREPQFSEAELARLADGSLPPQRQDELRTEIQGSTALTAALAEQERAVALIRATDEISAPASLRARIEGLTAEPAEPAKPVRSRVRWRPRIALPIGAVAFAAAAVLAIVIVGGGSSAPTIPQTAHVALEASTMPAPPESASHQNQLTIKVDSIPFPYWDTVGWRTEGQRVDSLGGRRVVTVFYTGRNGSRVGYAIVSGPALKVSGGTPVWHDGNRYTLLNAGGGRVVTWERDGHTCVIAGRSVNDKVLLHLATADEAVAT